MAKYNYTALFRVAPAIKKLASVKPRQTNVVVIWLYCCFRQLL